MSSFTKKNKIQASWNISFRVLKHEKAPQSSVATTLPRWEVQLLKYHKGEVDPSFSVFGDTLEEAWQTMLESMDRNEEYLKNTLNLSDEPYAD